MNLLKHLVEYTDEEMRIANLTSRTKGFVGEKAITPKYVERLARPEDTILDFGAGRHAAHAQRLSELGLDVTAYEFGGNVDSELHDPAALSRQYNIVYASNVLNVQSTDVMLAETLKQIHKATKKNGVFVFNFPASPRKGIMAEVHADDLIALVAELFGNAKRVGGTRSAPLVHVKKL